VAGPKMETHSADRSQPAVRSGQCRLEPDQLDLEPDSRRLDQGAASCEPQPRQRTTVRPRALELAIPQTQPPSFSSHPLIRGGHLQTLLSLRSPAAPHLKPHLHWVTLPDGDGVALHDDCPEGWQPGDASLMLVHGLCGCRMSPYMVRLADQFTRLGNRVFRLEMRGCGVGQDRSRGLTHAGRSDDCIAAMSRIAEITQSGDLTAIGVSLGGNQLLRAAGRLGAGLDDAPPWLDRWKRLVAVSPPVDLALCSDNMQRTILRGYNSYFIRNLLKRLPAHIRQTPQWLARCQRPWPKTLRELDDRITAPINGFRDAVDYYAQSSAGPLVSSIRVPTLILTAADDPIVPIECFSGLGLPSATDTDCPPNAPPVRLLVTPGGGHVGFFARGTERFYMDHAIRWWCT